MSKHVWTMMNLKQFKEFGVVIVIIKNATLFWDTPHFEYPGSKEYYYDVTRPFLTMYITI
jgi:hypothetical protein